MLRIHRLSSQLWMPVGNMADLKYRQHAMMKVHDETKREPFLNCCQSPVRPDQKSQA